VYSISYHDFDKIGHVRAFPYYNKYLS
jgi:hypothetical protein